MIVMGIDPGTRRLGWGVVSTAGTRILHVAHGVVRAHDDLTLPARLALIDDGVRAVIAEHAPTECGVESIFFARDPSAAAKLGHARGVVLLALFRAGVEIHEYPPATVKRAVAANGRAEKDQVARMVSAMLRLSAPPPADAADALAVAITHVQSAPARRIAALAASR
jgi:crossover junction endodeoxyribonuclease RuvC